MMETEALPAALQEPLVLRALEELKMLKQADSERERYESRRKAQLDDQTRLKVARLEGEKIGAIHAYQRLLNRPETPTQELASIPLAELTRLAEDLQEQVLKRTTPNGQ